MISHCKYLGSTPDIFLIKHLVCFQIFPEEQEEVLQIEDVSWFLQILFLSFEYANYWNNTGGLWG